MTLVNFDSFVDEFMRIKIAEEKERQGFPMGRLLANLGLGAAAYGVGSGTAGLVSKRILPKVLPHIKPEHAKAIAAGAGLLTAAGSLAFADAMRRNQELLRDAVKRDE
jgi:hypothetical protein